MKKDYAASGSPYSMAQESGFHAVFWRVARCAFILLSAGPRRVMIVPKMDKRFDRGFPRSQSPNHNDISLSLSFPFPHFLL
jgi:hypothetical protein